MPSEQLSPIHTDTQQDSQIKVCSSCHSTLVDHPTPFFEPLVCTLCRDRPTPQPEPRQLRIEQAVPYSTRPSSSHELPVLQTTRRTYQQDSSHYDNQQGEATHSYHPSPISSSSYPKKAVLPNIQCNISSPPAHRHQSHFSTQHTYNLTPPRQQPNTASSPDPLTDITHIRIRPRAHHCLYPGATFQGTQKSGRNSYDVNVDIVDVNFAASTLCGYLRIRGLTDDWPELTTYFDAEIIGNRYGFLTQNWGATQHEDLVHWSRFPAFKHIRHDAKRPHLTIDDRDRGVVFMRWKERFLVPDHRVQDINGASFAGFYYVCVDLSPPTPSSPTESAHDDFVMPMPMTPESPDSLPFNQTRRKSRSRSSRRDSSVRRKGPVLAPTNPPAAIMSGFYYHQNSEPYQQLSLVHTPEQTSSCFEFR